jgi:hypothetical protein
MAPVKFKDLPTNTLFRIFAERRPHYINGERKEGLVRSQDRTVYKKKGEAFSQSKAGKDIILSANDLVFPYVKYEAGSFPRRSAKG